MEYYSAMKRNEALTHATTRTNHDSITLSERSQMQRATRCMTPLIRGVQSRCIYKDRK